MSTIVLVGGSFLGAWTWERVTPTLTAAGHRVYPLTLTGFGDRAHLGTPETTMDTHTTDIVAAITFADLNNVVLVGHSYGAAPATVAANRIPQRIARIVYVAGVLPVPGKTLFESSPPGVEDAILQSIDPDGANWRVPVASDAVLDAVFGDHGLSPDDRAWLRARGTGQPVNTYRDRAPHDLSAVEKLPRTYIACTGDPSQPPIAADTPGFDLVMLDSGHWPMITKPAQLASMIDALARRDGC
jgi:pimeloyl-ACP methyl ester carboxylesterase